jgi:hypothetical protein
VPPLNWVLPFARERRIELDGLGLSVLNMCDEKATVERIVGSFAEMHSLSFREAQVPVVQFLKMLTQRGIIAIALPAES